MGASYHGSVCLPKCLPIIDFPRFLCYKNFTLSLGKLKRHMGFGVGEKKSFHLCVH
jgi:hypothetical protein